MLLDLLEEKNRVVSLNIVSRIKNLIYWIIVWHKISFYGIFIIIIIWILQIMQLFEKLIIR